MVKKPDMFPTLMEPTIYEKSLKVTTFINLLL